MTQFSPTIWAEALPDALAFSGELHRRLWPEPEYLPIPWHGRVRNWLYDHIEHLLCVAERAALPLAYHPKVKPGTEPERNYGTTIKINGGPYTAFKMEPPE